jgi:hypothetical protein
MTAEQTFNALQRAALRNVARCAKSVVEDIPLAVYKGQLAEVSTFRDSVCVDAVEHAAAWDPTSNTWS